MLRIVLLAILLGNISLAAQEQDYPQGYFRSPLNIPILLAGNFGECRPGHFHSGMDIKTEGRENLPVFAAADGYISRIKMEPGGFGHGLYITHSNGYTTLYAHLNDFVPAIQRYVREQQYTRESWTVDLIFTPDQFPVKKGDQIAFSGNTGGSTAPHLHFEIRDSRTEHPLNPQLFGFGIKDTKAPLPTQIALYAGLYDKPANLIRLVKKDNVYCPAKDSLAVEPPLSGLGIVADDFMEGSENTLAFYTAEWYDNDRLQGRIRLDDIGYDETRYLHAYADYGIKFKGGPWVQDLFRLPGNHLNRIYESLNGNNGMLEITDTVFHQIRVVLKDVYGNTSEIKLAIRNSRVMTTIGECTDQVFEVNKFRRVDQKDISFHLDESSLYKTTCFQVLSLPDTTSLSKRFMVGRPDIPVHHYFELSLKPDKLIPFALRSKVAMIYTDGKEQSGRAAIPSKEGWYKASVRGLGEYRLLADTSAPVCKPLNPNRSDWTKTNRIAFRATDNLTSVKSFRGELDGKWILFEQHEKTWIYVFDGHCSKGSHRLVIKARDENDNETTASYTFAR